MSKRNQPTFDACVAVMPRGAVLDPQGKAIEHSLARLGYEGVSDVRAGKVFRLTVQAADLEAARAGVGEMAEQLLANPVMEDWTIEVEPAAGDSSDGTGVGDS